MNSFVNLINIAITPKLLALGNLCLYTAFSILLVIIISFMVIVIEGTIHGLGDEFKAQMSINLNINNSFALFGYCASNFKILTITFALGSLGFYFFEIYLKNKTSVNEIDSNKVKSFRVILIIFGMIGQLSANYFALH